MTIEEQHDRGRGIGLRQHDGLAPLAVIGAVSGFRMAHGPQARQRFYRPLSAARQLTGDADRRRGPAPASPNAAGAALAGVTVGAVALVGGVTSGRGFRESVRRARPG